MQYKYIPKEAQSVYKITLSSHINCQTHTKNLPCNIYLQKNVNHGYMNAEIFKS